MKKAPYLFWPVTLCVSVVCLSACNSADSTSPDRDVFSSGAATILGTYQFSFDAGSGGTVPMPPGSVADVWWRRRIDDSRWLEPQNGATFAVLGSIDFDGVTWAEAAAATKSEDPIAHADMPVGTVLVYATDAGRVGKFRINAYADNAAMSLDWVTWE